MVNPLIKRRRSAQRQGRENPLTQKRGQQPQDPSQFRPVELPELTEEQQTLPLPTQQPTPLPDRTATQIPVAPPAQPFDAESPFPQQPIQQERTQPIGQPVPIQPQQQPFPNAFQQEPRQPNPTPPVPKTIPIRRPVTPQPTPAVSTPAFTPQPHSEPFPSPAPRPQPEVQEKLLPRRMTPPGGFVIETNALKRIYKLGDLEIPALRGVNIQIGAGELVALKGRSGSGKTTLLNCIGGLDRPTEGVIAVFGEEIGNWSEQKLTTWRRKQVGFIFQSLGLLPTLSAYENVELMLRIAGFKRKERHKRAVECLELVGLGKWVDHRPFELSGGQQQRVAIARALATSPQLLIADEPTGELDSQTGHEILSLFKSLAREQNMTMLMATHDGQADEYVDYILHMQDGQVVQGAPH